MPATEGGGSHAIVGSLEQVGLALVMTVPLALADGRVPQRDPQPVAPPGAHLRRRHERAAVDRGRPVHLRRADPPATADGLALRLQRLHGQPRAGDDHAADRSPARSRSCCGSCPTACARRAWPSARRGPAPCGRWCCPTARSGITTAVVLGIARAVGETAPLLFTAFGYELFNANPFYGPAGEPAALRVPQHPAARRVGRSTAGFTGALVLHAHRARAVRHRPVHRARPLAPSAGAPGRRRPRSASTPARRLPPPGAPIVVRQEGPRHDRHRRTTAGGIDSPPGRARRHRRRRRHLARSRAADRGHRRRPAGRPAGVKLSAARRPGRRRSRPATPAPGSATTSCSRAST